MTVSPEEVERQRGTARSRRSGAIVASVLLIAMSALLISGSSIEPAAGMVGVATGALAVCGLLEVGISSTVARRYPDVVTVSGINVLTAIIVGAIIVAVGIAALAVATDIVMGVGLVVLLIIFGVAVLALARGNHNAITSVRAG